MFGGTPHTLYENLLNTEVNRTVDMKAAMTYVKRKSYLHQSCKQSPEILMIGLIILVGMDDLVIRCFSMLP